MDFMNFLKSVEQFLYEVLTWLVFYPITLWRIIFRPLEIMQYSTDELSEDGNNYFTETMNPPLFLLLTLLITRALGLGFFTDRDATRFPKELTSETNIFIVSALLFAVFPMAMAVNLMLRKGVKLDRGPLRAPFYSQCYVAAPLAFSFSIGSSLSESTMPYAHWLEAAFPLIVLAWYSQVQVRHLRAQLGTTLLVSTLLYVRAFIAALAIAILAVKVLLIAGR